MSCAKEIKRVEAPRRWQAVGAEFWGDSARKGIRAGGGHEPLGYPVIDMFEPVVEPASMELNGGSQ